MLLLLLLLLLLFNVSQHAIRLTLFFIENLTLQILISMIHLMHPLMVSVPCKARYHLKRKHFAINSTKYLSMTCLCVLFNSGAKKAAMKSFDIEFDQFLFMDNRLFKFGIISFRNVWAQACFVYSFIYAHKYEYVGIKKKYQLDWLFNCDWDFEILRHFVDFVGEIII